MGNRGTSYACQTSDQYLKNGVEGMALTLSRTPMQFHVYDDESPSGLLLTEGCVSAQVRYSEWIETHKICASTGEHQ